MSAIDNAMEKVSFIQARLTALFEDSVFESSKCIEVNQQELGELLDWTNDAVDMLTEAGATPRE